MGGAAFSSARMRIRELNNVIGSKESGLDAHIQDLCDQIGEREAAHELGISRTALRRAMSLGSQAVSRPYAAVLRVKSNRVALRQTALKTFFRRERWNGDKR